MKPTRRELLGSAVATGVVIVLPGCKDRRSPRPEEHVKPPTVPAGLTFFTAANYATAIALFERLFPADEDPGATELGVAHYIDGALAGAYAEYQPIIRLGLGRLDADAGTPFYQLPAARQDELLRTLEQSGQDGAGFLEVATTLVIEAALADPIHRGSTSTGGWKVIGFTADACARPDSRGKP
jgi:hypothetical protein